MKVYCIFAYADHADPPFKELVAIIDSPNKAREWMENHKDEEDEYGHKLYYDGLTSEEWELK